MNSSKHPKFFQTLHTDLPAGMVVFLVAVPLCLGIALASGAPLFSGIIAGIVGGLVVTLLSGSNVGVSGPAAGLVVIVLTAIETLGSFEVFLFALFIAGIIQLLFGIFKAGVVASYFPSAVIKGMLSGIGLIIILKQIPHAFGYDFDPEGDFEFFQRDGHNTFSELVYMLESFSPGAIAIVSASLLVLILWEQPFIKRFKVFQVIQGPLVVVGMGIGLNIVFGSFPYLVLDSTHLVNIPVAASVGDFIGQFSLPDFSQWVNTQTYVVAFTLAIVASLETLLCLEATDKMDPLKRKTPANRELVAQGVGNMISGLIGGLPVTQVIVRSSTNIQSGGLTKASALFHGILLLLSALFIPGILNMIPLASLAAILIMVGYKLCKPSVFKEIYAQGWPQFIPFMATILGIVFTDMLMGIGLGLVVAIFQILIQNYRAPYYFETGSHLEGAPLRINLPEHVSFLHKARMFKTLNRLPAGSDVTIDASMSRTVHPDVLEIIHGFRESEARQKNITIRITGLSKKSHRPPEGDLTDVLNSEQGYSGRSRH